MENVATGAGFRAARVEMGHSKASLSRLLHITEATISRIESSETVKTKYATPMHTAYLAHLKRLGILKSGYQRQTPEEWAEKKRRKLELRGELAGLEAEIRLKEKTARAEVAPRVWDLSIEKWIPPLSVAARNHRVKQALRYLDWAWRKALPGPAGDAAREWCLTHATIKGTADIYAQDPRFQIWVDICRNTGASPPIAERPDLYGGPEMELI